MPVLRYEKMPGAGFVAVTDYSDERKAGRPLPLTYLTYADEVRENLFRAKKNLSDVSNLEDDAIIQKYGERERAAQHFEKKQAKPKGKTNMGYEYNKSTDPERAAARWRAKSSMSPSEFAEWEAGIGRSNRGEGGMRGPSQKKLAGLSEDDDFTTALGRKLGYEKREIKTTPIFEDDGSGDPKLKGQRGPGIYVPEGGAFSGAGFKYDTDKKIAGTGGDPMAERLKKHDERISKMGADDQELEYRKRKGWEIPAELTARREKQALEQKINAGMDQIETIERTMAARRKPKVQPSIAPPPGDFSAPGKSGNPIVDQAAAAFGADDSEMVIGPRKGPLEVAAAGAPAVAFNGNGPLAPSARAVKPMAEDGTVQIPDGGDDETDAMRQAIMANIIPGYKPVDRTAQRKAVEKEKFEQRLREIEIGIREAELRDKNRTPEERHAIALRIKKLDEETARANRTPLQIEQEEAALAEAKAKRAEFERTLKGQLSPNQERLLKADAAARATAQTTKLMKEEKLPYEKARAQANAEANAWYRKEGGSGMIEDADNLAPKPDARNQLNERLAAQNLNLNDVMDKTRGFVKGKQSWSEYLSLNNPFVKAAELVTSPITGTTPQKQALERIRDGNEGQVRAWMADQFPGLSEEDLGLVYERMKLAGM